MVVKVVKADAIMDNQHEPASSYIEFQRVEYKGPSDSKYDIFLDGSELIVGRSPAQSTMIIPDPLISRQHVRFDRTEDGKWTITDLSLNGVLLNSRRLVSKRPTPVSVSDTLQLDQPGKYRYRAVEVSERPPPAKRALTSADYMRKLQERKEAEARRAEAEKKRQIAAKQEEIERQRAVEARAEQERRQQEQELKEAAARLQQEKEREEAMRREAEQQEARIKEEKEKLEARLQKMQEELDEQQAQAEQAAKEREEYEQRMATLKEEMERREREAENEKRLREQLQRQEADLKDQLSAEIRRLEQERRDIEQHLKGELEATKEERQQTAEDMQQRCAAITTQLSAVEAKRRLLEARLADTEREKEAVCGRQLEERKAVLDGFGSLMDAELTCSICQELFFTAITLNCTHTFCSACISEWRKQRQTCPICREVIGAQTRSLVLDNFIDGMVRKLGGELQEHRDRVRREREAAAAVAPAATARVAPAAAPAAAALAAAAGRGRHGRRHQQRQPRQQWQQQRPGQQQHPGQQQRPGQQQPRPPYAAQGRGGGQPPGGRGGAQRQPAPNAVAGGRQHPGGARPVAAGRRAGAATSGQLAAAITAALQAGANPQHPIVIDDTAYVLRMQ